MAVDVAKYPEPQLSPKVKPRRPHPDLAQPVIVAAARTPIGKFLGGLSALTAPRLGAVAIQAALQRAKLEPDQVDEVIMGNVLSAGLGQNPARQATILAGLDPKTSALTVNKVCASGLKAIVLGCQAIRLGDAEVVVAGGMESMSNAPYLLDRARTGYRLGHGQLIDSMIHDGLWDCYYDFHMGNTGELVAERYRLSRAEQDEYAYNSHAKALQAQERGDFLVEIAPVEIPGKKETVRISKDEGPRPDTSVETLAKLKPAFVPGGTVTAGNAPSVNDGAAAVVIMSEGRAQEMGLKPLARVLDAFSSGVDPAWVMLTPVPAVRGLLGRNPDWKLSDFDVIELNEAFSVQALAVQKELSLDPSRVNPCGGAVALGHPIGASGARIVVTLLHELTRRGGGKGLATLCLGGGNGLAVAFEAMG